MILRQKVVLTTVEEDFRKIGLLPPLSETDDPSKPREVPSPDPSTLAGLDDSEGDKSAHSAAAKQPKPKLTPDEDDHDVPDDAGGKVKAGGSKVSGSKESSMRGEAKEQKYTLAKKQPMVSKKKKGKDVGQKPAVAQGLKPVKKVGGMKSKGMKYGGMKHGSMKKEGILGKAASLIEEVETLLYGVQVDEEIDNLLKGFGLVSENAALLADRLTEISDRFNVEKAVDSLEDLSRDAAEAIGLVESELETLCDEDPVAIANSADAEESVDDVDEGDGKKAKKSDRDPEKEYDVPSPAFKEQVEQIFGAMVYSLMEALEAYDSALDEIGDMEMDDEGYEDHDDDGDDDGMDWKEKMMMAKKAKAAQDQDDAGDDDDGAGDDDQDDDDIGADDGGDDDDDSSDDDGEKDEFLGFHPLNALGHVVGGALKSAGKGAKALVGVGDDDDESYEESIDIVGKLESLRSKREELAAGGHFRNK